MTLYKLEDFAPDYQQESFDGKDIKRFAVKAGETEARVGFVRDVLVDESGHFRYFVVETGFWIFGKQVLLPVGRALVDADNECIYALGISTVDQAEALPKYHENMVVDYEYEEKVRANYRSPERAAQEYDRDTYSYDQEKDLYELNEKNSDTFKLYQERLIANKKRQKTGEVKVGKKVESETAKVSVPVEKERVVIERHDVDNAETVAAEDVNFSDNETVKMDVYEETADIKKQAFVREEASIHKEVQQDSVDAEETLRKEELEVDTDGENIVKN
ncbi:DUF2382 domain-containing protein [Myxosarcina sp. GI1(2024)]